MAKLYFKYGAMGSSKSANALMCKFNYEQKGFKVLLMKPSLDTRDNDGSETFVASRIGLKSKCYSFSPSADLVELFNKLNQGENYNVVIVDESQFCTTKQIEDLKTISRTFPVLCYGLKTNFKSYLFEGSKRLFEIADSIAEIKSVCKCGCKATMNAKLINGKVVTDGKEIDIGGDEKYEAMCYNCWKKLAGE